MSYTSVYAIYKTKATSLEELRNGHGSGLPVWDYISLKCTGEKFQMFDQKKNEAFWPLWKDTRVDADEKAVLLSTYDGAVVEVEHLKTFAEACRKLHQRILSETSWTWSHWDAIAAESEALAEKHDYRCKGLGIGCTSVSDPWEFWKPEDREIWGVYASIESLKAGEIE